MNSRNAIVIGGGESHAMAGGVLELIAVAAPLQYFTCSAIDIPCIHARRDRRQRRLACFHNRGMHLFLPRISSSGGVSARDISPETIAASVAVHHDKIAGVNFPLPC